MKTQYFIFFIFFFHLISEGFCQSEDKVKKNAESLSCKSQALFKKKNFKNCPDLVDLDSLICNGNCSIEIKKQMTLFNLGVTYINSIKNPDGTHERMQISNTINQLSQTLSLILFQLEAENLKNYPDAAIRKALGDKKKGLGIIIDETHGIEKISETTKAIDSLAKIQLTIQKNLEISVMRLLEISEEIKQTCGSGGGSSGKNCDELKIQYDNLTKEYIKLVNECKSDSLKYTNILKSLIQIQDNNSSITRLINNTNTYLKETVERKVDSLIKISPQVEAIYQKTKNDSTKYIIQMLNGGQSFWSLAGSAKLAGNNFLDVQLGTFIHNDLHSFVLGMGYGKSYRQFIFHAGVLVNTNNNSEYLSGTKTFNLYTKISAIFASGKKIAFAPAINFSPLYGISVGLGIGIK